MTEPTAAAEPKSTASDPASNGDEAPSAAGPATVFEGLREAYAQSAEERRITIPIAPGRFDNNLAARYAPGPWSDYRKKAEKVFRHGGGEEVELGFAASIMVRCIETIMFRPADDQPMIPMHEAHKQWKDGEPVKFDERLAEAVGLELGSARDPVAICRLVFKNPAALNDHFVTLDAFLKEAISSDEDEDDEGGGRPT